MPALTVSRLRRRVQGYRAQRSSALRLLRLSAPVERHWVAYASSSLVANDSGVVAVGNG